MDQGEAAPPCAEPKGNAEALRQKDRIRTILRKGRHAATEGATLLREGNLSGYETGAQSGSFAPFLLSEYQENGRKRRRNTQ